MSGQLEYNIDYYTGKFYLSLVTANNDSVVILLPGQSLPAEMFFGISIYEDGSSITDKIISSGIDVAYLDPVGYGRSQGTLDGLYDRRTMADQMVLAIDVLTERYKNIFLHGFCSTSHVPMIAATKRPVQGLILQSPLSFRVGPGYYKEYMSKRKDHKFYLENSLENLKENRLKKKSDVMLGFSYKADHWEKQFLKTLSTFPNFTEEGKWRGVTDMMWDLWLYPSLHGNQGWSFKEINCPVSVMKGEMDYECSTEDYDRFKYNLHSKLISENIVPNGTHFGMWNKNYDQWAETFIKSLKDLFKAQESVEIKSAV